MTCCIGLVGAMLLRQLEGLGMGQFAIYLQRDAKDDTLATYGGAVMPAMRSLGRVRN
jgi:hypothetical protein